MQNPPILIVQESKNYDQNVFRQTLESIRQLYGQKTMFISAPHETQKPLLENVFTNKIPVSNAAEITESKNDTTVRIRASRVADYIRQQAVIISMKTDEIRNYMTGLSETSTTLMDQINDILDSSFFAADNEDLIMDENGVCSVFRFVTKLADQIHLEKIKGSTQMKPFTIPVGTIFQIIKPDMPAHTIVWTFDNKAETPTAITRMTPEKYIIIPTSTGTTKPFYSATTAASSILDRDPDAEILIDMIYSRGNNKRFMRIRPGETMKDTTVQIQEKTAADELVRETRPYLSNSILTTDEIRKYM